MVQPLLNLDEVEELGSRREVASAVLQLINDDDTGALEVAHVASSDPLLSAKIMRMANSAYYGLSGRVSELHFAVSVLGFLTVRSLAVASLLNNLTPISKEAWKRYAVMASLASGVAVYFDVDSAMAFCSGMMLDLGELILAHHDPRGYRLLHKELSSLPLYLRDDLARERERSIYGLDHTEIGARLLRSWNFPNEIVEAVGSHHDSTPRGSHLARVLYVAAQLAPFYANGSEALDPSLDLPSELLHLDIKRLFESTASFVQEFVDL
jgi:HD-like signal output (HDOD) protein